MARFIRPSFSAPLWVARVAWVALALIPNGIAATLASHGRSAQLVFTLGAWALWALGTLAIFWLSPYSLSALRMVAPLAAAGLVGFVFASLSTYTDVALSDVAWSLVGVAVGVLALVCIFLPAFGLLHVQASAYGDEKRLLLRVPATQIAPIAVSYTVMVAFPVATLFALGAEVWWLAALCLVPTILIFRVVPKRLHRFSRRWLVVVPAGVVVHDELLLAETFMVRTTAVTRVDLSATSGDALNLTGDIAGVRRHMVLVVQLREAEKLALSPYLAKMLGTLDALHVQSYAVAPTLAGHALAALTKPPATT
ncbi:MAG: hypothetical protein JHC90_02690 [Ilumatobacteraceae bacterium]|nr:hypothetical protein [Ilumatobacteraceae bacterium]